MNLWNITGWCSILNGYRMNIKKLPFFPQETCHIFDLVFRVASIFRVHCWAVFRHMVFVDGFLFPVKELGLLTNPGHWVRVLDVVGSYMYIVL
jgi:hypothetical protein